jgi:hypothetical protein
VIETLAFREPAADGVNVTEIVHVALAASVAGAVGQPFVCAKSPAFVPATAMLLIVSGALPVFCTVEVSTPLVVPTGCEAKLRVAGVKLTAGAGVDPVPLRPSVCGLSAALSVIVMFAELLPAAPGVNVTEMVHVAFASSVAGLRGQVFVCA